MKTIKKLPIVLLILLSYAIICKQIYTKSQPQKTKHIKQTIIERTKDSEIIGTLTIPKINIKEKLYQKDSSHNNIEEHVTILKESKMPNEQDSIIFLAAHSGSGSKAYFNHLNQLTINDLIILTYNNQPITYIVKNIWEETKTGYIHVNKEPKPQLILTTCSPTNKNKQLIINSIKKETT